ncbi:hypothetical protein EROM_041430 [Encephalitozoon romaleae SJ-2008]|uniref:Uncharacterized protein n=1 Tax=Encephalitozoon romaleae (strain SJ-2008) TaxID=1178016 RepID=I6ZI58_ENCRO|nr:hypothetical protein EROM_041430 [Encephalitozoon romaleae SJ-2008]AFN82908.1 hypothetical protein EROM_041430 [Encephalitozoon romaleae SJ-2008]
MIILMIIGYLHAIQNELTARCRRYGISLNDCLNSVYLPKKEYDEYLQSFNLPIVRDSSCNKGRCMAVVYKDVNRCMNCRKGECKDECREFEWMRESLANRAIDSYKRDSEPQFPFIHVIHHREESGNDRMITSKTIEPPSVSYKSVTVIETKTETVSEKPMTTSKSEDKRDTPIASEASKTCETQREEVKTVLKTVEVPKMIEKTSCALYSGNQEKQKKFEDNNSKVSAEDIEKPYSIPTSIRRSKFKDTSCDEEKTGYEEEGEKDSEDKYRNEPTVVTVTRVFSKTITTEKPITLYREVTTTIKSEVPIINYKLTTVRETSTITKIESSTKTETVVQTQYSTIVSTKTQYAQEPSATKESSIPIATHTISGGASKRDEPIKDVKTTETSTGKQNTTESPSVVYRTVTQPSISILTVTKTQENTVQLSSKNDGALSSAPQKMEGISTSSGGPGVGSLICTEKCSTVGASEVPEKKGTISSVVVSPLAAQSSSLVGRQDIIAELLPLVRKVLVEDSEETKSSKASKNTLVEKASDVVKTVTRTVVRTVGLEARNRGRHKIVYNTIFSYKKKPNCKKGVEGGKSKGCKDSEEVVVTTAYV